MEIQLSGNGSVQLFSSLCPLKTLNKGQSQERLSEGAKQKSVLSYKVIWNPFASEGQVSVPARVLKTVPAVPWPIPPHPHLLVPDALGGRRLAWLGGHQSPQETRIRSRLHPRPWSSGPKCKTRHIPKLPGTWRLGAKVTRA